MGESATHRVERNEEDRMSRYVIRLSRKRLTIHPLPGGVGAPRAENPRPRRIC